MERIEAIPVTRWLFWMFLLCGVFFALLAAQGCQCNQPKQVKPDSSGCADIIVAECREGGDCRSEHYLRCKELGTVEYLRETEK